MLDVNDLSVTYGDGTVGLYGVTFHIAPGERCGLIGANGAGKTSLLMALVGVTEHGGTAKAGDCPLDPAHLETYRRKVGVVFQNPDDQLFMPTIYQDVAFGLENMGMASGEISDRVNRCLSALGISHLKDRSALRLSGGEKRMAALATVLVMEPEVLLLDEPTAFLDPGARRRLMETLRALPQTMVIATHDLGFAWEVCPRAMLLKKGKLLADGAAQTLLLDKEAMAAAGVESIDVFYGGYGRRGQNDPA